GVARAGPRAGGDAATQARRSGGRAGSGARAGAGAGEGREAMIELQLPAARVAFTDRRGGVSKPPYDSLNLGILTDDEQQQVGEEVLAEFADLQGVANGRMLSLNTVAQRKLQAAGVTQIDSFPLCTSCRPDLFFSHRRDDGVTGRQAGLVWRT